MGLNLRHRMRTEAMTNTDTKTKQHFTSIAIGGMTLYAVLLACVVFKDIVV